MSERKEHKSELHPRNKHRGRYDFDQLIKSFPGLSSYVHLNKYNDSSVDFFDPKAVKALNKALLIHHYGIKNWDIPPDYLCPAIPGRADYIHYAADLLKISRDSKKSIRCIDIGVGANCVYPIIGVSEYNWDFVGSDIDPIAISSAEKIVEANEVLQKKIELRVQKSKGNIFHGILEKQDKFDLVISNPPFHSSQDEADKASRRKIKNLSANRKTKKILNFEGKSSELWIEGGELGFVKRMIKESAAFKSNLNWCTSLISKEKTLHACLVQLENIKGNVHRVIEMGTGNKRSRILAWRWIK